jgi:hypothetical protein
MTLLRSFILALSIASFVGCKTNDFSHDSFGSVFLEAPESTSSAMRLQVQLAVSGLKLYVLPKALVQAEEILATDVVEAGDPDLRQRFLLVQVDRDSAAKIMEYSAKAIGKHFVFVVNEDTVGIMPIEQQIVDGNLLFHVEQKGMSNDEAAVALSKKLNATIVKLRKLKDKEGK